MRSRFKFRQTNHLKSLLGAVVAGLFCALAMPDAATAEDQPANTEQAPISFHKQVRPIFQANCVGCHQPAKDKGEYVMTSFDRLMAGGDSEKPAIVPGNPDASHLVELITTVDGKAEMPKKADPLTETDLNTVRKWIEQGAHDDTPDNAKQRYDKDNPPVYTRPPVITSMDYSPDGSLLAVAGFHEVLVLKPDGSELVARLIGMSPRITSVRFSPDGEQLAVTGGLPARSGEVQIWDMRRFNLKISVPITYDTIYGASWSPDGQSVAFACADNTVRAIDARTGEQIFFNGAHNDWVLDTVFTVDGKQLISVGRDMSSKLHEFAEERFIDNITSITPGALKGGILAVTRHPTRDEMIIGGSDGQPKVYRIHRLTKRVIGDDANAIRDLPAMRGRVTTVSVSDDGSLIAAGSSLDARGQVFVYPYNFDGTLPDDVKAAMSKVVTSRNAEEKKRVEDYRNKDVTTLAKIELPETAIYAVTFSPDGKTLAAAGGDGMVRLISTETGQVTSSFSAAPVPQDIAQVTATPTDDVDFILDVNPVISRLGCNAGTCHGAAAGRNGFKLSLRGYDPIFDIRAFTDDHASRRVNLASPDDSLMLLKATGAVPHEGGQLIKQDSDYYNTIRQWIAAGATLNLEVPRVARVELSPLNPVVHKPGETQQMKVIATYTDGKTRDVTNEAFVETGDAEVATSDRQGVMTAVRRGEAPILARYEGAYAATTLTVMGDREGFTWEQPETWSRIDELVADKWQRMKIQPSGLCTDEEFIRRIYLDLTGLPPTAEDVTAFLADGRETRTKRDELIDQLIGDEEFIEFWTNKWADLLQVNGKFLGREGATAFRKWIRDEVENNTPYDEFARKIITADGSNKDNPAASYYKVLRDPVDIMENTTHLFMAVRFNCNKCHDHPFERWTQDQYYELSAYFARVGLKKDEASGDKIIGGTAVEGAKPFYEIVYEKNDGDVIHDRTKEVAPPQFPFDSEFERSQEMTRRQELAAWLTSPDNHYFAKSYANRLWGYMFGTGIIEPIDDIRAGNPPTNPQLLDYLTEQFIENDFDMRHMLTMICKSRTYQLSYRSNNWNEDDKINFSHATPRRLPAEVLFDSVHAVTGAQSQIPGVPAGTRAAELPDGAISLPSGFLDTFGRPVRESACECERSSELQLGPVMALISGPDVANAIASPDNAIAKLVKEQPDNAKLVDAIFMRVLNRHATDKEVKTTLELIGEIEQDHQEIAATLEQMEKQHAPEIARLEAERTDRIKQAEAAMTAYEQALPQRVTEWAAGQTGTNWQIAKPSQVTSEKGTELAILEDQSVLASGTNQKDMFEVTITTDQALITGIRLEMLLDDSLPNKGPGRGPGNGNFVLTEFEVLIATPGSQEFKKVGLANAKADFSQDGFDVTTAIDGNAAGGNANGWAVHPQGGKPHTATFEIENGAELEAGSTIKVRLIQNYGGNDHQVGRFRLSLTSSATPFNNGPPAEIAVIINTPEGERTDEQKAALINYFRAQDAKHKELAQQRAEANKPVPLDPDLVEQRRIFKVSTTQSQQERLTIAQDLTWALINSPAFLFNH